jgi:hypothetical protein
MRLVAVHRTPAEGRVVGEEAVDAERERIADLTNRTGVVAGGVVAITAVFAAEKLIFRAEGVGDDFQTDVMRIVDKTAAR